MSFLNFHTNSYISAIVHHTNPYITLWWPVCKLATCTRQIFLSKLLNFFKLAKQVDRIRNTRKQKLVMIKNCSEKLTNSLDTREETFLAKTLLISQKLTRTTCARRSHSFTAWNLKSCVFIPEKLTFSLCLRTKTAAKNLPIHVGGSFV